MLQKWFLLLAALQIERSFYSQIKFYQPLPRLVPVCPNFVQSISHLSPPENFLCAEVFLLLSSPQPSDASLTKEFKVKKENMKNDEKEVGQKMFGSKVPQPLFCFNQSSPSSFGPTVPQAGPNQFPISTSHYDSPLQEQPVLVSCSCHPSSTPSTSALKRPK